MKIPARGRILSGWTPPPPETQRECERGHPAAARSPCRRRCSTFSRSR
ncbi:MAG: hypothetical protein MZV49_00330 [Rhodopseudomonas palustris]|nr:hypothetical protein [Rhodopseudomonas palustris]